MKPTPPFVAAFFRVLAVCRFRGFVVIKTGIKPLNDKIHGKNNQWLKPRSVP
jgi:hypothetical protein